MLNSFNIKGPEFFTWGFFLTFLKHSNKVLHLLEPCCEKLFFVKWARTPNFAKF